MGKEEDLKGPEVEHGETENKAEKERGNSKGAAVLDVSPEFEKKDKPIGKAALYSPTEYDPDNGEITVVKLPAEGEGKGKEDETKVEVKQVGTFAMFRFASPLEKLLMICGTLSACAHGAALPMVLVFFGDVIDAFIGTTDISPANSSDLVVPLNPNDLPEDFCAGDYVDQLPEGVPNPFSIIQDFSINYVILGCCVLVVAFIQSSFWNLAAERQVRTIRILYFRKILGKDIEWFDNNKGGELTTRISDDIDKIRSGIGDKIGLLIQSIGTGVAGIIVGFVRSWQLSLVIVVVSLLLIVPLIAISGVSVKKLSQEVLDSYATAGSIAEEVLGAMRTVAAFGGEGKELNRYTHNLYKAKNTGIKKGGVEAGTGGAFFFVIYCSYAAAFGFGTYLILNLDFTAGGILVTFFCVLFGAFSLAQAGPNFSEFATARGAAAKIYSVIDEEPVINCMSDKGVKKGNVVGKINFENVKFCYPSRPDIEVLKGLNLEVNVGQTVALVGSSGCGKSTVVNLIQRFYDPNSGIIRLDGVDIRELNVRWLRESIGVVSQEPILFATTIAENISYGRLGVTMEEIEKAAQEANAFEFIQNLPDKFQTLVGERGAQLSGGQKQRIAIARALVRNPKILLLDEATSALDTESEGIVQAALEKVSAGRTTLVIAHRLSTIKNSDMICAFKDGDIIEKGTHAELMNIEGGVYQGLVNRQQTKETMLEETEDSDKDHESEEEDEEIALDNKELEAMGGKHEKIERADSGRKSPAKRLVSQDSVKSEDEKNQEKAKEEEIVQQYFSWGRVMKLNSSEWFYMVIGTIAAALNGGVQPSFAVLFSQVLKAFGGPKDELAGKMLVFCLIFVGIGFIALFSQFLQGFMFSISGEELTLRLRHAMFKAMLRQEVAWFDDHSNNTGALTTRLATEASLVQGVTGIRFGLMAEVFFNIVVAIIISFIFSWQLTLLVLAFVPMLGISGVLQWKLYKANSQVLKKKQEESGKLVSEAVENIRTVQSLTREEKFHSNYCDSLKLTYKKGVTQSFGGGLAFSVSQGIIYFAYAAAFRLGGHLVQECSLEFDQVFLVFSAIVFGAFGLGRAFALTPDFSKAKTATARMFQLIDRIPPIDVYESEGITPVDFNAKVSFEKVRFRYPTRPDVPVLQGLSVSVDPGETLALVGSSGCGKSTSVSLLERFYEPRSGELLLDTYDLKDLNLAWLRQQIGLVSQEPVLFDRTISENIAYGDNTREVSQEEIEIAAMKANIHSFVVSLPEAYQTRVGDKGTQLSGGQKQRIAIARALVRNPKILLLDEATSALDTESEKVVQEALDEAKKGRTCITIAHRLSTIHDAEKIAVIRHGKVAEFGTHEELIQIQEQYYSLYTAQSLAT